MTDYVSSDHDIGYEADSESPESSAEMDDSIEFEEPGYEVVEDSSEGAIDVDTESQNDIAPPESAESQPYEEGELPPISIETEEPDYEVVEDTADTDDWDQGELLDDEMDEAALEEEEVGAEEAWENDIEEPVDADDDEVSQEIQEAVEIVRGMDQLEPEAWEAMDASDRAETLQELENNMAELQDRPAAEIVVEEMDAYGGYQDGVIYVNGDDLASDMPVDEFVDTAVHEGRHAYQEWAVQTADPSDMSDEVALWADNMSEGHYLDPEQYGYELYASQAVEADAARYAGQVRHLAIATNEF